MEFKKILVSLVAILVLAFAFANVSAFADIESVEVNGVEAAQGSADIGTFASETIAVKVVFKANENASDVRLKVWIAGASEYAVSSERFDVYEGSTYSRLVAVRIPSNIDPTEDLELNVNLESRNSGSVAPSVIKLAAQRESYIVEILDVNMDNKIQSGNNLAINVVLKNRGSHLAEDTFVKVKIPSLGIEERAYFGDMSPLDQSEPDKEDAVERNVLLRIPSNAEPGIYSVEIEAFNGDSSTTLTKKVVIVGASEDSMVVSSVNSKTFAVGGKGTYTVTLVNSGNRIKVYELVVDSTNENLNVEALEPIVAIPAGLSKTVQIEATAAKAGKYNFAVNVESGEDLVKKESFTANVEGSTASKTFSGNTAIILTVVLAIVFVVLLIVLIVLLTRKPEKSQETGESYY